MTGSLSEGEKTAIAFCYFLATLAADGRRRKDLVVVVDDPVSSLDTRALNYVFSLIKSSVSDAAQVIIMTHNLHFMDEVKKWLKRKTESASGEDKATATLLSIQSALTNQGTSRSSSIVVLPKYIREYDSEYQYLFNPTLSFAAASDDDGSYFHIVPNGLRKILEIFLAFKYPGSEGLSNKIESAARDGAIGLDPDRMRALDRLVQLESHGDNLDDLVTYSSTLVEEARDAARTLLEIIEALDKPHYERMCRICRS